MASVSKDYTEDRLARRHLKHNHGMHRILGKNIRTIFAHQRRQEESQGLQTLAANAITDFSGSMIFVYVHIVWFGAWILLNTGWGGLPVFDQFPYGLLTMIVSLEAIFLSTFVLISQNRSSAEADRRNQLALHIGLLTEYEVTQILKLLDDIHTQLGIEADTCKELSDLEQETRPEDVLAEIERLQAKMLKSKFGSK